MDKIEAPFTEDQVINLNLYQQHGYFHPFTGFGLNEETSKPDKENGQRSLCPDGECLLIATTQGWVCPCGQYTQNWAHKFMAEAPKLNLITDRLKNLK